MPTRESRLLASAAAFALIIVCAVVSVPEAAAAPPPEPKATPRVAQYNPHASPQLIESLPKVIQDSTVHLAPDLDENAVFFYPDGRLVEGQSAEKVEIGKKIEKYARETNQSTVSACATAFSAVFGVFTTSKNRVCALFGHRGYKKYYSWHARAFVYTSAVVHGKGFRCKHVVELPLPGQECGPSGWITFYESVGAGNSGGGYVYWGNNADYPQVRAQAVGGVGFSGIFE